MDKYYVKKAQPSSGYSEIWLKQVIFLAHKIFLQMSEKIRQKVLKAKPMVRNLYSRAVIAWRFLKKEVIDDPTCYESSLERP